MKRLRSKMTTEELADSLKVARQTVNRWIRQQGWKTERVNGVKGGRARLIHVDARVRDYIMSLPAVRNRQAIYQLAEAPASYGEERAPAVLHQITDVLEKMTPAEQEHLAILLAREGILGFLTRLGIRETQA
ncbi:YfeC-like transcriptional regulator [Pseudenterobacter timonensis]|uniref:YfeC-like transcriptional regulator n=1 Tax=Pseudenterobacter timonensis TaxID=1755099 RepID=A0ABV4A9L7_9ENTR|nr:YfeC-like transcriptional regulator [Pseudenterobacter timonensis]